MHGASTNFWQGRTRYMQYDRNFIVEDGIVTEPDVVGKTLNNDFICPDGT